MDQGITVGVAGQAGVVEDLDTTEDQAASGRQRMYVQPDPDARQRRRGASGYGFVRSGGGD